MTVIAFDTASPLPAVAVLRGGDLFEQKLSTERRASEDLLPALDVCLAAAGVRLSDCERIIVCAGPGSFTGVRIGLATAWGLRRALGVPLEAVSTLEAMAEAARSMGSIRSRRRSTRAGARSSSADSDSGGREPPRCRLPGGSRPWTLTARRRERSCSASLPASCPAPGRFPAAPRAALVLAAARAPRADAPEAPEAIYSRPSAAEEKHGAA